MALTYLQQPVKLTEEEWKLLLRLKTYNTVFSLDEVSSQETPTMRGRFELYKLFFGLNYKGYIKVVKEAKDSYTITQTAQGDIEKYT